MTMLADRPVVSRQRVLPAFSLVSRSESDEFANVITHGIGLVLSIVGGIVLMDRAALQGDGWRIVGCGVFTTTLITTYAASTLAHGFSWTRWRRIFRMSDQASIYLLIAGTYTPFGLAYLRTGWWWLLFGLVWTVALCGFVFRILFWHCEDLVAIWSYVLLGWLPIVSIYWLLAVIPAVALWWIFAGGLCYSLGMVFLVNDQKRPYFHAIWHVCVLAGSTCHFFVILVFVASVLKTAS
jgi:hemolysin III